MVWAMQKARLYLARARFDVLTEHQPLVAICNGRNLDAITNTRIQCLMAKTLGYEFRVLWTPRKTHFIANNALSRAPVFMAEEEPDLLVCTVLAKDRIGQENNCTLDPGLAKLITIAEADVKY